jgi:hypothetical protein
MQEFVKFCWIHVIGFPPAMLLLQSCGPWSFCLLLLPSVLSLEDSYTVSKVCRGTYRMGAGRKEFTMSCLKSPFLGPSDMTWVLFDDYLTVQWGLMKRVSYFMSGIGHISNKFWSVLKAHNIWWPHSWWQGYSLGLVTVSRTVQMTQPILDVCMRL